MPKGNGGSGRVVSGGEFFSPIVSREKTQQVFLAELRQAKMCQTPRHEHALAYLTVVLTGDYAEYESSHTFELGAFTAIFNPCGVVHAGAFGESGARLFTVELRDEYLRQLGVAVTSSPLLDSGRGTMLWPGLRLYSAFKRHLADSLTLEGHVLEILAAASKSEPTGRTPPPWFRRTREQLHAEFKNNLSMAELASQAGVHPVHLARVFRSQLGQTAGDYVRQLRVRSACDLLRDREFPLAAIAAECGFADQSHFTRIFKRAAGSTPGEFRKLHSPA